MQLVPQSWGSPLREANDCHSPPGTPAGGQFCSKGGRLDAAAVASFATAVQDREGLALFDLRWGTSGRITLETVAAHRVGTGAGTRAVQALTDFADAHGVEIELSVSHKGYQPVERGLKTTSPDRLRRFYRRFGFVDNRGRNKRYELSLYTSMYRRPK